MMYPHGQKGVGEMDMRIRRLEKQAAKLLEENGEQEMADSLRGQGGVRTLDARVKKLERMMARLLEERQQRLNQSQSQSSPAPAKQEKNESESREAALDMAREATKSSE